MRLNSVIAVAFAFVLLAESPGDTRAVAGGPRVLEPGKLPADSRLKPQRTFNDAYHPWVPPTTKAAWEAAKPAIRERMLVGTGLWPMPPAAPLKPVIHGKIDRDNYTIEKGKKYTLDVFDARSRSIWQEAVKLSDFGSFHVHFVLPPTSPVGNYRVVVHDDGWTCLADLGSDGRVEVEHPDLTPSHGTARRPER